MRQQGDLSGLDLPTEVPHRAVIACEHPDKRTLAQHRPLRQEHESAHKTIGFSCRLGISLQLEIIFHADISTFRRKGKIL